MRGTSSKATNLYSAVCALAFFSVILAGCGGEEDWNLTNGVGKAEQGEDCGPGYAPSDRIVGMCKLTGDAAVTFWPVSIKIREENVVDANSAASVLGFKYWWDDIEFGENVAPEVYLVANFHGGNKIRSALASTEDGVNHFWDDSPMGKLRWDGEGEIGSNTSLLEIVVYDMDSEKCLIEGMEDELDQGDCVQIARCSYEIKAEQLDGQPIKLLGNCESNNYTDGEWSRVTYRGEEANVLELTVRAEVTGEFSEE